MSIKKQKQPVGVKVVQIKGGKPSTDMDNIIQLLKKIKGN